MPIVKAGEKASLPQYPEVSVSQKAPTGKSYAEKVTERKETIRDIVEKKLGGSASGTTPVQQFTAVQQYYAERQTPPQPTPSQLPMSTMQTPTQSASQFRQTATTKEAEVLGKLGIKTKPAPSVLSQIEQGSPLPPTQTFLGGETAYGYKQRIATIESEKALSKDFYSTPEKFYGLPGTETMSTFEGTKVAILPSFYETKLGKEYITTGKQRAEQKFMELKTTPEGASQVFKMQFREDVATVGKTTVGIGEFGAKFFLQGTRQIKKDEKPGLLGYETVTPRFENIPFAGKSIGKLKETPVSPITMFTGQAALFMSGGIKAGKPEKIIFSEKISSIARTLSPYKPAAKIYAAQPEGTAVYPALQKEMSFTFGKGFYPKSPEVNINIMQKESGGLFYGFRETTSPAIEITKTGKVNIGKLGKIEVFGGRAVSGTPEPIGYYPKSGKPIELFGEQPEQQMSRSLSRSKVVAEIGYFKSGSKADIEFTMPIKEYKGAGISISQGRRTRFVGKGEKGELATGDIYDFSKIDECTGTFVGGKGVTTKQLPRSPAFELPSAKLGLQESPRSVEIPKIKPSGFEGTRAQSAYYGTGQYERTDLAMVQMPSYGQKTDVFMPKLPRIGLSLDTGKEKARTKPSFYEGITQPQAPKLTDIQKIVPLQVQPEVPYKPRPQTFETPLPPPPITPGLGKPGIGGGFFPLLPSLGLPLSIGEGRIRKARRKYERKPSLISVALGITAPKISLGEETGLVSRPILTGTKRRKKK